MKINRDQSKGADAAPAQWGARSEGYRTLFRERDKVETGHGGPSAIAAALAVDQIMSEDLVAKLWQHRLAQWKIRFEAHCNRIDLAPDLADNIGSARWLRGLGTLTGLAVAALAFWPDFSAVEAATTLPADPATRDEFRSQMIMPLALGGDSGRRMGAGALVQTLSAVPERPTIQMVSTLGQGDSFGRMLQRAGVGAGDATRVSELVSAQVPLNEIGSGTRFDITLGRRDASGAPRPLQKLTFRARFDLDLAVARSGGRDGDVLALARHPLAVDTSPLRIRGSVGPSLYRSARAAGAPVKAIQQYLQTIDSRFSLDGEVAPTDQFDFVVAYKRAGSGESETGDLLFAGLERGGRPLAQLVRWGSDGQFYEASGNDNGAAAQGTRMFAPVNGHITSGYGMRRHPILGYVRMHAGIDFGAAWGSPIYAVNDGIVSFAGRHGGHGNYVRLEHGGGLGTGYGHMSRIAVAPGTRVRAGQVLGFVGSSGLSTGPHLHFEVYKGGATVNPLSVSFTVKAQIDTKQRDALKARLFQLKAIAPGAALKSLTAKQAITKSK
jgi:murein DD-endopeptidase MepM/ murein hydrolase activator NlpD